MKRSIANGLITLSVTGMFAIGMVGCADSPVRTDGRAAVTASKLGLAEEVEAERAKLSPDDRALVEAQEWCVVQTEERLGSMGPPIKLDIKGQTIFICCKGCKRKAEADPEATLAKQSALKAKAKVEKDAKQSN